MFKQKKENQTMKTPFLTLEVVGSAELLNNIYKYAALNSIMYFCKDIPAAQGSLIATAITEYRELSEEMGKAGVKLIPLTNTISPGNSYGVSYKGSEYSLNPNIIEAKRRLYQ